MKGLLQLACLLGAIALSSCMFDNTVGATTYATNYTISLASLPDSLPLDSVRLNIALNGKSDSTIAVNSSQLASRSVVFTVHSAVGQSVTVEYAVYSESYRVAHGTDQFNPSSSAKTSPDSLKIDTLPMDSALAAMPKVNEALQVSFSRTNGVVLEGQSVSLHLVLEGDSTAKLVADHVVQLQCTGGTVTSGYYTLTTQVTLPKGAKLGDSASAVFASLADNKVMGNLIAVLKITDGGGLKFGSTTLDTVTVHDADTAWVEFPSATQTALENAGPVSVPVTLKISPSTSTLGVASSVKALFQQGSALLAYDYSVSDSLVTFAIGAKNGDSQNFAITLINDGQHDSLNKQFSASLSNQAGPTMLPSQHLTFTIQNNNYEYVAVLDSAAGTLWFYTPEGVLAKSVTNASLKSVRQLAIDSLGEIFLVKNNMVLKFNPVADTSTSWTVNGNWQTIIAKGSQILVADANGKASLLNHDGTSGGSVVLPFSSGAGVNFVYDSLSSQLFYAAADCSVNCNSGGEIGRGAWGSDLTSWLSNTQLAPMGKPEGLAMAGGNLWSMTADSASSANLFALNSLTGLVSQQTDLQATVASPLNMVGSSLGHLYILNAKSAGAYQIVEYNPSPWATEQAVPHQWDLTGSFANGAIAYYQTHTQLTP